jgi:type I restriction enzyme M protein
VARDKANLDLTWLSDPSAGDADAQLPPEVIAREIVDDLQAALAEFEALATSLEAAAVHRAEAESTDA